MGIPPIWRRIKHGKIVGYDNDCYVIETLVDDTFGYMHLKDEDISKNYEELISWK